MTKDILTRDQAQLLVDTYGSIRAAARHSKYNFHQIRNAIQQEIKALPGSLSMDDYRSLLEKALATVKPLVPVPARIKATKVADMGFDTEQVGVALWSDTHYGSYIDPRVTGGLANYNEDIADERIRRWRDGVLRFTQQDQTLLTVRTLHLFVLGDDIEGHGDMFITQKLSMTDSVGFVVGKYVARMAPVLLDFLERYEKVIVYKVRGNHGRVATSAKGDYPPDNFEIMAWRNIADRVAQHTGGTWSIGPNGVEQLLGGLIEFYIYPSLMAFVDIFGKTFVLRHGDGVKGIASTYCVTPETRILTRDARWVPAKDLLLGQRLLAFEDNKTQREGDGRSYGVRHYADAEVVGTGVQIAPVFKLTLADGREVRATGEHKWLAKLGNQQKPFDWVSTEQLAQRSGSYKGKHGANAGKMWMPQFFVPWGDEYDDRDGGFLAGAFDADGSITQGKTNKWPVVRFTQYDNALLAEVEAALTRKGFSFTRAVSQHGKRGAIYSLRLTGGRSETLRFIGQVRPPRLLAVFSSMLVGMAEIRPEFDVEIASVEPDGDAPIVALTSSSGTYLTEYGASHNTGLVDNKVRMNAILGEVINYYLIAHHHEAQSIENEIGGESMVNGCLVGPSLLSVKMQRPAASIPSQEFFLLHPKHGITNRHRIRVATVDEMRSLISWTGRE